MGRVDVDQMLEQITPEQMDEWIAYYRIEPFGEPWRQAALIAAEARNAGITSLAPHLGRKLTASDMVEPDDYLNGQKQKQALSPEAFQQIARAVYGNNR